ncbi:MAG: protein TolQ [Gammaproteobacteria bacterium]
MGNELDAWHVIANASWPIKAVMLILLSFSLFSWVVIFSKMRELSAATRSAVEFEDTFWSGIDLASLFKDLNNRTPVWGLSALFMAGFQSFMRLRPYAFHDAESLLAGCQRSMRVALSREQEVLERQLPFLATVGSISPYVGLLGTVWGIMNSFLSLSQQSQVTLQVVAPDIAEALLATAMGLVAAIPAVVAYNRYTSKVDGLVSRYEVFAEEFSGLLHRKAHERVAGGKATEQGVSDGARS